MCLNCNLWALGRGAWADLAKFGCISTGVLIHIGYAVISAWVDGTRQYKVNIYTDLIIKRSQWSALHCISWWLSPSVATWPELLIIVDFKEIVWEYLLQAVTRTSSLSPAESCLVFDYMINSKNLSNCGDCDHEYRSRWRMGFTSLPLPTVSRGASHSCDQLQRFSVSIAAEII